MQAFREPVGFWGSCGSPDAVASGFGPHLARTADSAGFGRRLRGQSCPLTSHTRASNVGALARRDACAHALPRATTCLLAS